MKKFILTAFLFFFLGVAAAVFYYETFSRYGDNPIAGQMETALDKLDKKTGIADSKDGFFKKYARQAIHRTKIFIGSFSAETPKDIKRYEDAKFIYYEIDSNDLNINNIKIEIEPNTVILSGDITASSGNKTPAAPKFYRSFPAPKNVDTKNAVLTLRGKKIIILFPKT